MADRLGFGQRRPHALTLREGPELWRYLDALWSAK